MLLCGRPLTPAATHVDHFIAWKRYPVDLGHNFVLANSRCNSQKRHRPPACEHLAGGRRPRRYEQRVSWGRSTEGMHFLRWSSAAPPVSIRTRILGTLLRPGNRHQQIGHAVVVAI